MCTNMHMCSHQWDIVWIVTQRPSRSQKSLRFFQANILINNIIEPCINKQTWDLFRLIRVNRGEWLSYEAWQTPMEQTKTSRFMLEGPWPCTIFCFELIHYAWVMEPKCFCWLVPQSIVNNSCVLCTVKVKRKNKNMQQRTLSSFITISFYWLWANLSDWLTGTI